MGLIRELQGVSASLSRSERARRERERLRILQENYKNELKTNLSAEFYSIFKQYDTQTAYNTIIKTKEDIIDKICNIMSKITYTENGVKYYAYNEFDIFQDLEDNFYKILNVVQRDYTKLQEVKQQELLIKLENKIKRYMRLDSNKYLISIQLKKYNIIKDIINGIATTEERQKIFTR